MLTGYLIKMMLSDAGSSFSETPRASREIAAWSEALADMGCGYLERLAARTPTSAQ